MSDLSFSTLKEVHEFIQGTPPLKFTFEDDTYVSTGENRGAINYTSQGASDFTIQYIQKVNLIIKLRGEVPSSYYCPHDLSDQIYLNAPFTAILEWIMGGYPFHILPTWYFVVMGAAKSAGNHDVNELSVYLHDNDWGGGWEYFYKMTGAVREG